MKFAWLSVGENSFFVYAIRSDRGMEKVFEVRFMRDADPLESQRTIERIVAGLH